MRRLVNTLGRLKLLGGAGSVGVGAVTTHTLPVSPGVESEGMKYFAVHYQYPDGSDEIVRLRPEHRAWLSTLAETDRLVGSGPYVDGQGGALIVIRMSDTATLRDAEELMDNDPFTREGVLAGREVREWKPVLNVFRSPTDEC